MSKNTKIKQPNHLASLIDHQLAAKSLLPTTLADTLKRYSQATDEVKRILAECLPEEILDACQVAGLTEEQLTLSVQSQTAANHIRYLQSDYVNLLCSQSITFANLRNIRVIVTHMPQSISVTQNTGSTIQNSPQRHSNKGLSETTRQTIAHVATHVITDEKLKKTLLKLAKED